MTRITRDGLPRWGSTVPHLDRFILSDARKPIDTEGKEAVEAWERGDQQCRACLIHATGRERRLCERDTAYGDMGGIRASLWTALSIPQRSSEEPPRVLRK